MGIFLEEIVPNSPDYTRVESLYYDAFPSAERMPFALLIRRAARKNIAFLGIYSDEEAPAYWVGFFYLVEVRDMVYVWYFAVDESQRSRGYGSRALKALREKYPDKRIVLDIEKVVTDAANYDQRITRRAFYLRNGFQETDYVIAEPESDYRILVQVPPAQAARVSAEEIHDIFRSFAGFLYRFRKTKIYRL